MQRIYFSAWLQIYGSGKGTAYRRRIRKVTTFIYLKKQSICPLLHMQLLINKKEAIQMLKDRIAAIDSPSFDATVWKDRTSLDIQIIFGMPSQPWLQVNQLHFKPVWGDDNGKKLRDTKMTAKQLLSNYIEVVDQLSSLAEHKSQQIDNVYKTQYETLLESMKEISSSSDEMLEKYRQLIDEYNELMIERNLLFQENADLAEEVQRVQNQEEYFPIGLLDKTRGYLVKIGTQCNSCFGSGHFDACLVMLRKLIEALIIECFERYNVGAKIKNGDGHYFFLSDLIACFEKEASWTPGRNTSSQLAGIKKFGDASAHNRRFNANRTDLDSIRGDVRIVIEELVHLIDYPSWNKEKSNSV